MAQESSMERVGKRLLGDPAPACQAGYEGSLAGGAVTILPGQTLCLKLELRGESVLPVSVVSVANPEDTLILKFWQEPGTDEMFLSLHNPLSTFLRYQAYMLRPGQQEREYTSSCPVLSKRIGVEQWPHLVSEITLSGFTSLPESKALSCQ